ncbi:MAG: Tex family protein [bacterium]
MNIPEQLKKEFQLAQFQIDNTITLLNEGATVPFIARYRKERTGSLDEIHIRDLQHKYTYYCELEERRTTIIDSIKSQGKLTPDLLKKIEETINKTELEDLYLPYKPKRITRGKKALDAGLRPLAQWLVDCNERHINIEEEAAKYINPEKGFDSADKALTGACDIFAEELADNADIRKWLREYAFKNGVIISTVKKDFSDTKTKFSQYYDYKETVKSISSHRIHALFRGEREKVLRLTLEFPDEKPRSLLEGNLIKHPESATAGILKETALDCLNRLLAPATETEIRKEMRNKADEEAFKVFGENLRALLLSPPAGRKAVLGVDPGFRTGCKVVALDSLGKFLEYKTIFPHEPHNKVREASLILRELIDNYAIELIAIGNGTASRETDTFIKGVIKDIADEARPLSIIVNESGASVYSASDVAIKEFPDQDITVRGAISIARRLQDPLSELVKIDPKSIGVGQYQHDVNQSQLKNSLSEVVESCVNCVGVDVNLASAELLTYVSGLSQKVAENIVAYRNNNGAFTSRHVLNNVPGLGKKTFEQAAGFLRIPNADNPLDNSAVHPERYAFVRSMASKLSTTVRDMIGNSKILKKVDKSSFITDEIGLPTIEDIIAELEKPGRDPRDEFSYATFNDSIHEISDLKEGMKLEGTVTNVTNFGAFVDIGVHHDGLVHISQMADRFIDDPRKIVKVGQVLKVKVIKVDPELNRISLSMKA